jgi:hypothetical protein
MPHKSVQALSVVPAALPQRPKPPAELTEEQASEWRAIVGCMPVDYFQPAQFPLLVEFCRHVAAARVVAQLLDATDLRTDLARYDRLSRMHVRESQAIAMLATKMRLTHTGRQRIEKRTTMTTGGPRPWE